MQLVADLHLHSRYATGVSPAMTLENISVWALRKGLDLLGTGDCLQPDWQREIEGGTQDAEPGFLTLTPELQERVWARVPEKLRRPLRFVWSTEVDCLPPPKSKFQGLHHLIYFPSLDRARSFADGLRAHGELAEGRPTVNLNPLQLLESVLEHGPDCHFAPAHVLNPWFSDLGTIGGEASLEEIYVDHTSELVAVETGLTSNPRMCRRVSSLDRHTLFSNSDAHSLETLGREYTVFEVEPSFHAVFDALRNGTTNRVVRTVKYPLYHTRYFLNWCTDCKSPFDSQLCPRCRRKLVTGSRDRVEAIADRTSPQLPVDSPPFQELLPLADVVAKLIENRPESPTVKRIVQSLIETVGHERYILTGASEAEIGAAMTPQLARTVTAQRNVTTEYFREQEIVPFDVGAKQELLDLGLDIPTQAKFP